MQQDAELWREACGPGGLQALLERLARQLAERLPLGALIVRRLVLDPPSLETVGAVRLRGPAPRAGTRSPLPAARAGDVASWCRAGGVRALRHNRVLPRLLPDNVQGDTLAAPLSAQDRALGVLLAVAAPGRGFEPAHTPLLQSVLAPVVAALAREEQAGGADETQDAGRDDEPAGTSGLAETIVGAETGLRDVLERVRLVAATDVPVLVLGETGSGKEVVARALHSRSRRAGGPVLRVNCGAIPPDLVDSELFGHERGSFTGAVASRLGWFERADGGTLFLDEVGELPPAAQVRLLRVLQDGTFERVGGQETVRVDVRIVAATHRDLQDMVTRRQFREDLWYRIGVFPIVLPPLRDRRDDIPALAAHFARRAAQRLGAPDLALAPADLERLLAYGWPGNIRELAAVIERAAILGGGRRLEVSAALGDAAPARPAPATGPAAADDPFPTLLEATRRHIEAALRRARGRIEGPGGAAALLDVNPHTLRAQMRRIGVDWARFRASAVQGAGPAPRAPR